jgi:chromatin segregation and condensation protein Rec8/ScpA/Scc1 (kleisin family)
MKTMRSTSTNKVKVAQQKHVWVLTHRSKRSSRIASIRLKHLKVKEASPQVKLTESKSAQESREQLMNQSHFLASLFLNLEGEILLRGLGL